MARAATCITQGSSSPAKFEEQTLPHQVARLYMSSQGPRFTYLDEKVYVFDVGQIQFGPSS